MQNYQQLAYLSVSHAGYFAGGSVPQISQPAKAGAAVMLRCVEELDRLVRQYTLEELELPWTHDSNPGMRFD